MSTKKMVFVNMLSNDTVSHSIQHQAISPVWLENAVNQLKDAFVIIDSKLSEQNEPTIAWANDAFFLLSGYCSSEIIGKSLCALHGPLTDENAAKTLMHALQSSKPCQLEMLNYKKDGSSFWNRYEVTPIANELGDYTHCVVIQHDVSKSKLLEASIQEQDALFRTLSETSPVGLFGTDSEGNCTYTNERWQQIFGMSFDESLGTEWLSAIHPEDKQAVHDSWAENNSLTDEVSSQFRILHKDGTIKVVRSTAKPLFSPDQELLGFVGTVVDMTETALQEEAILKSKRLLKEMGAIARVGAWELDLIDNTLEWTEETFRIYGLPLDYEPKLDEAIQYYAPKARPIIRVAVENAIATGEAWDLELPFIQADGNPIWVRSMGEAQFVNDKPVRLIGSFQDITETIKQRTQIENMNTRMSLATDCGGIGIWEYNLLNQSLIWDQWMFKLYGVSPQTAEQPYALWTKHLHPDDRTNAEQSLNDAIAGIRQFDTEFRVVWHDGSIHHLRAFARVIHNDDGTPIKMIGVNWDITAHRLLANELAEQHELMQVTLRSIGDAVITADAYGNTQWLNPVAEKMTGWSVEDIAGKPLSEVFHTVDEKTRMETENPVEMCLQHMKIVKLAKRAVLISRDGKEYGIEESASPILNQQGKLLGVVLVFRDVSEQRRLSDEMSFQASHDPLTGLVNRVELEARVQRLLVKSHYDKSQHALMFIDLDQFKIVNDTCGHAVGDELLKQIAKMLGEIVRETDTLARLGGDEFCIVLEQCAIEQAQRIGQLICDTFEDFRFVHGEHRFRIGSSIGLVPVDDSWPDVPSILQAADTSCYAAKDAGRNRVHIWFDSDETIQARHSEKQWTTRIEKALDEDRFVLYAQLLSDLSEKETGIHAEVLLRMHDKENRIILPNVFLPAAERFHLAARIDRWVLRNAIDWLVNREADDINISMLCINLSGQSVGDRSFHVHACQMLSAAGESVCKKICVEITETAAVTNMTDASSFISKLKQLGVKVALDDFGAGAASFGYLKHLDIDILKIDGQFISDLLIDPLDDVAVRFFIEVARVMNFKTVAEFVNTQEVLSRIKDLGINYAQGYLLHKPEPIDLVVQKNPHNDK